MKDAVQPARDKKPKAARPFLVQRRPRAQKTQPPHRKENGNWKPQKWTPEKVGRIVRRAYRCAATECECFLGPHEGRIAAAQMHAERKEVMSVSLLRARVVRLTGDE